MLNFQGCLTLTTFFLQGRTLLGHDYVFWCGDFNYRVNMCREDVLHCVKNKDWETLLSADQLKIEKENGNVFDDFNEGEIDFAPTYKYDLFSEDYDTSEKCRVPAWTDRVLWRRRQLSKDPVPGWSAGTSKWYGRAELKQSDHRPILAILDVEVHKVDSEKREKVFQEALKELGPPDGSIVLSFDDAIGADLNEIFDEHFAESLKTKITEEFGDLRFIKFINEMIWVAFNNYKLALDAVEKGSIEVCGHTLTISLKNLDWRHSLDEELEMCSAKTIPLCQSSSKDLQNLSRETKRHNLSQLSQLSFEELGDIIIPSIGNEEDVPPSKPPPPRPAPPPPRPGPPPARPAAPPVEKPDRPSGLPPARPAPPPSRPAPPAKPAGPPPTRPSGPPPPLGPAPPSGPSLPSAPPPASTKKSPEQEKDDKGAAGFSDIFSMAEPIVDPDVPLPISDSIGSLVNAAATKPISGSSSNSSLANGEVPALPSKRPSGPPPKQLSRESVSSSASGSASTASSAPSTPMREMPAPPTNRAPPPLPGGRGPPGGPPPSLPSRPPAGPPPALPKR